MTIERDRTRASGHTVAEITADEASKESEKPVGTGDDAPDKEQTKWKTPGFARMRLDWRGHDRLIMDQARDAVDHRINVSFTDAFVIMNQVYDLVRQPRVDANGEIMTDRWGMRLWVEHEDGSPVEDFNLLTSREKEHLIFQITTRLFLWEQRAADAWGEAMMAKAQWEESFAIGFNKMLSGTVDDRTTRGRIESRDERYFAIFQTWYSRRADSVVKSMERLGQRLKDSVTG